MLEKIIKKILTYLTFTITILSYSQDKGQIDDLEKLKLNLEFEIQKLQDSIKKVELKIVEIKSENLIQKINDSSLTCIARKGAKIRKDWGAFAEIITTFEESKKVTIIDYKDGYFKLCINSICGYIHKVWIDESKELTEFVKLKEAKKHPIINENTKTSNYNSSLENSSSNSSYSNNLKKTGDSSYKPKRYQNTRNYIRGPRGGCYYINSNGNKTYVDRSLCN